jgi:hypothetical protein
MDPKNQESKNNYGVKCVTAPGWLGGERPRRFTRDEAAREAERVNAEDPVEVWEVRKLPG